MSAIESITYKHRIRQLVDGRFVAEEHDGWIWPRWKGVDAASPQFLWGPDSGLFAECIVETRDEALQALAERGV